MPLTSSSKYYDVREANEDNLREATAYVLEGLACSMILGRGTFDFKLPFEINIKVFQELCDWQVVATTTLEYNEDWLKKTKEDTEQWLDSIKDS